MKNMVVAGDALMGDFMNAKENKVYEARNGNRAMAAGDALMNLSLIHISEPTRP